MSAMRTDILYANVCDEDLRREPPWWVGFVFEQMCSYSQAYIVTLITVQVRTVRL